MLKEMFKEQKYQLLNLLVGSFFLIFVGWQWPVMIAPWLVSVFLIRYFRKSKTWLSVVIAFPVLTLATFVTIHGGWAISTIGEFGFSALKIIPLYASFILDRYMSKKVKGIILTLIYPLTSVFLDYIFSLILPGLGACFSWAPTQFSNLPLIQIVSITGLWGVVFIMTWFGSVCNAVWENYRDLNLWKNQVFIYAVVFLISMLYGSISLSTPDREDPTVRIGSVTVAHEKDYWAEILDKNTPKDEAVDFLAEFKKLEDKLFDKSEQAVLGGAKIILWSEANAWVYEDQEEKFLKRASAFAKKHNIYLMPGYLVAKYGTIINDNKLVMIDPDGEIAYHYTKTFSWYPTESDGVVKMVDTPYGTIAGVVCFDMDFPGFIRKAGKQGIDIMLVPAFDTKEISPYHTEVGLLRAIENGFSIVRQVNKGTSTAVDTYGRTLTYQDFFRTEDRIMYSDVPTKGHKTIYLFLGDWLPISSIIALIGIIFFAIRKKR